MATQRQRGHFWRAKSSLSVALDSPRGRHVIEQTDDSEYAGSEATLAAQGVAPMQRLVRRVQTVTRREYESLVAKPGVYAVDTADESSHGGAAFHDRKRLISQSSSGTMPSSPQVSGISPGIGAAHAAGVRNPARLLRRSGKVAAVPRFVQRGSIFGLPTFRPDHKAYIWWSFMILILDLTYTSFVVPISIGMLTSFWDYNWTSVLDYSCGALFFTDLVLSFHAGYVAVYMAKKVLILDGKLIAKQYLKSTFFFDLASTIAWVLQIALLITHNASDAVDFATASYVMEVVRLIRFMRIVPLVGHLSVSTLYSNRAPARGFLSRMLSNATMMYFLLVLYVALVLVNFIGCLWNFVAGIQDYDNTWVNYYPPFIVAVGSDDILTKDQIKNELSDVYLYFAGTYWALTTIVTVGYGDIVPRNLAENLVTQLVELTAIVFHAMLFGTVAELIRRANSKTRRVYELRNKMDSVERWMRVNNLPPHLQSQIKAYYADIWVQQVEGQEELKMFRELPHLLQNEVAWECTREYLRKSPLLRDISDEKLHLLTSKMQPVKWGPGVEVATQGDLADRMWVLMEGELLSVFNFQKAELNIAPCLLGESVLLQDLETELRTYPCTFRTLTHCTAWCIRWKDVQLLLKHDPHTLAHVSTRALESMSSRIQKNPDLWSGKSFRHDSLSLKPGMFSSLTRDSMMTTTSTALGDQDDDDQHIDWSKHLDMDKINPDGSSPGRSQQERREMVMKRLSRKSAPPTATMHHHYHRHTSFGDGARAGGRGAGLVLNGGVDEQPEEENTTKTATTAGVGVGAVQEVVQIQQDGEGNGEPAPLEAKSSSGGGGSSGAGNALRSILLINGGGEGAGVQQEASIASPFQTGSIVVQTQSVQPEDTVQPSYSSGGLEVSVQGGVAYYTGSPAADVVAGGGGQDGQGGIIEAVLEELRHLRQEVSSLRHRND